jgi:hypothetical protein
MPADAMLLADCIRGCAAAKDGRGCWRAEQAAARALMRPGEPAGHSVMQAAAPRRLGEWLRGVKLGPAA